MQPRALGQRRINKWGAQVDPAPAGLQHALHEVTHLGLTKHDRCELWHAVEGDENTLGGVDPNLFDHAISENALQRAEAGEGRDYLPAGTRLIGQRGN